MPPPPRLLSIDEEKLLVAPDLEPVKKFVAAALVQRKKNPGDVHYRHIVVQLRKRDDKDTLWKVLIALVSQVSLFTSQPDLYRELISAIFHYNWDLEWKIRVSLVNLIYHMVTANALLLLPSLQLLVKSLQYRDNFTSEESLPVDSFNTFLTRPNDLYSLVHRTIRCLTSICPSGQSSLFPILSTNFPYKMDPISDHHNYTTHLLVICQYLPLQQFTILELIISKCVEIDVEIHIEDTGEVKLQISESNELFDLSSASHCSQFAPHQEIADSSCSLLNGAPHTPGASSSPHLNDVSEMADKLDSMLLLLLSFLDSKINEEGVIKEKVLNQILKIFENQILLTHKSKFVQFLLFYLASKDSKFATLIPKFLSSFFFDERSSFLKRQSAVVYLGSYLARANFVSASLASSILESLLHWCYVYATTSSGFLSISVLPCYRTSSPSSPSASDLYAGAASPSSSRSVAQVFEYDDSGRLVIKDCTETMIKEKHSTFLCCVQTICYVLCFYGTEVAQYFKEPSLKRKLETVLSCSLLPLRHCAASIRFEFSRLARHEGLLSSDLWDFVLQPSSDAIKPGPSQVQDPEVAAFYRQAQSQSAFNVLESFFPFDPCLISGLHQKVESSYRDWGGLPGVDTAITEGEIESSDGEQEEEEEEDGTLDSVASSMMSMSVMSLSNDRQHHTRSSSVALSSGSDVSHWVHQSASSPATNGMMMQQSNEDQDNYASGSQWKINARRPRQFSVGSTGSW